MTEEPILCSQCWNKHGCDRIIAIVPQSDCEDCGRKCLGYQTELPQPAMNDSDGK